MGCVQNIRSLIGGSRNFLEFGADPHLFCAIAERDSDSDDLNSGEKMLALTLTLGRDRREVRASAYRPHHKRPY